MSFIAKNPLSIPKIETTPSLPMPGTRALFATEDGWYDIDSDGVIKKLGDNSGGITPEQLTELYNRINELEALMGRLLVKTATVELLASAWVQDGDSQYSQVVSIDGVTQYSKIDLQPTTEQLLIFYQKDISFVTENDDGVVTVYCIGQKPTNDYTMQVTITEVKA